MNKRQYAIIAELKKKTQSLESLAEQFSCSQRTIRNDLNTINEWADSLGAEFLSLLPGGVIEVPSSFLSLDEETPNDLYAYKLSKAERKMVAATLLIHSAGYITLSEIADNLYVSRATIISDLPDIKTFIREGDLTVTSHPNKGLRVEGKESSKRWFLFRLSAFDGKEGQVTAVNVEAGSRIILRKIISEQEQLHRQFLSDSSFLRIQKYLGIMLSRNLQGEYIEAQDPVSGEKFLFAQSILKYVSQYFEVSTALDEIHYLARILESCHYIKKQRFDLISVQIQMLTRNFIQEISEKLAIPLQTDYEFFESLSNHIESMMTTSPANFPENEALEEIMEQNPDLKEAVLESLTPLEQFAQRKLTDNEILYIVIHVCAAIERKKNREIAFHVVISCHSGLASSQLLIERLKKHFNFQIVDIVSSHEAAYVTPEKADLIISTVPLSGCQVEHIVVSSILTDEDYIRVGNKIDALRSSRNLSSRVESTALTANGLIEQLEPIIRSEVSNPSEAASLLKRLKKEIRSYFHQSLESEQEIFVPSLHHLLPPSHIQLDVDCADWKEAIRASALPLLKANYIEERYITSMIQNVEENGPYIVLSPGFAMPHEGLEMGSVQVGMNLIRLKAPVNFDADEFDPVEFVCCLSAIDHKTHLKALFHLVNMLTNAEFKESLRQASSPAEAAHIIEQYEYSLEIS